MDARKSFISSRKSKIFNALLPQLSTQYRPAQRLLPALARLRLRLRLRFRIRLRLRFRLKLRLRLRLRPRPNRPMLALYHHIARYTHCFVIRVILD
jgi:hypothetical protein